MPKQDETGKCSKCAHSREIANAATEAERMRLGKTCLSCIRGCDGCTVFMQSGGKAVDRYFDAVLNGPTHNAAVAERRHIIANNCDKCTHYRDRKDPKRKFCRTDCRLYARLSELDGIISCYTCNRCPKTDDIASHGGREVVSFDAAEDQDTVAAYADPLATEQKGDFRDFDERPSEDTDGKFTKRLNNEQEDELKRELANFASNLDLIDRELAVFLINGGSLVDFGRMEWAKKYIKTISRPMTKQAVHGRYKRIVKAMPLLKAVAHGTIGKGKGGGAKKAKPKHVLQDLLFDLSSEQSDGGEQ